MKRRGYWGEGLPASFEIIIFSLNRYLDSNGLLQNLLLLFFYFFFSVFLLKRFHAIVSILLAKIVFFSVAYEVTCIVFKI